MSVVVDLYPHQVTGVNWLVARSHAGLFDEMGLGKTATAICAAEQMPGRLLVACPAVVAHNWARELAAWSGRRVQVVTDGATEIDRRADAVIVTHGLLIRERLAVQLLACDWGVAVLDEAHLLRNPRAKRTRAFYGVPDRPKLPSVVQHARRVWTLTGTPVPNNPTELWTMLAALAPERLAVTTGGPPMSWWQFRRRFCLLQPSRFDPAGKVVGTQNMADLRARLRGFALRRRTTDVLDLPPLRWCTMPIEASAATRRALAEALPAGLAERLAKLSLDEALDLLRTEEAFARWAHLCGLAKVPAVVDLLASELGPADSYVLFAHHLDVIDGLVAGLAEAGLSVRALTGRHSGAERQAAVDAFQSGAVKLLVCQLTAGGVGITLTRAHNVGLVERSWVPGDNWQAVKRCHRIGQTHSVLARDFTLTGSVDELVADVLARKTRMIQDTLR